MYVLVPQKEPMRRAEATRLLQSGVSYPQQPWNARDSLQPADCLPSYTNGPKLDCIHREGADTSVAYPGLRHPALALAIALVLASPQSLDRCIY